MSLLRALWLGIVLLAFGAAAQAHKASDSYLQIDATEAGLTLRWDIALRDLDAAIDLDTNEDGRLTWAEVKTAWPRLQGYALARLQIEGCALRPTGQALERRNDGAYAVIFLASDCRLAATPVIRYGLFREVDPTHRGIAKLQRPGQPPVLTMLNPTEAAPAGPASTPPDAGAASAPSDAFAPSGAWAFLREGIRHILTGYDHVLFLLCLLLPAVMRRTPTGWQPVATLSQAVWPVVGIVSAFTVAHSITLALAATKVVSLSPAFIEPAIAVTIILAALDNIWPIFPVKRVVVTFFFGLIHGFGFAGVLAELNLPTAEFAWALLQFNLGLEAGQLMIVVSVTALLFLLRQRPHYRAWVVRGGSVAALLVGLLWLIERTANVSILPI
ncbi:MAG: HupE/UreJ family protein [Burkholderiaceae bacterium]